LFNFCLIKKEEEADHKPNSVSLLRVATIYLGQELLLASSGQPEGRRATSTPPIWPCTGWGLPSQKGHPFCW